MFGCQRVTRCLIGLTSTFYTSPSILSSLSEFVNKKETIRSKEMTKIHPALKLSTVIYVLAQQPNVVSH